MTHLIHVGNSFGVRIPKVIINQVGFKEDTKLAFKITKEGLLISPIRENRGGWDEAFKTAGNDQKDIPLFGEDIVNEFDKDEWVW